MMELSVDECWRRGDSSSLVALMYREGLSASLVTRLHRHVTKELHRAGFSGVGVLMKALGIVSERDDDLQLLLTHGLGTKVLLWFETLCGLLTSDLHRDSAPLLSLMEQFYDYFLLLAPASLQAPVSLLLVLLVQLARLVLEPGIIFRLRLEAIRTYNSILESLSREQRRQIQTDTNQCNILDQMAAAVLIVGDYELQVSLSEALCRLTPRKDREQRANQWFCSRDISGAFCNIRDGDFEVDCRRFLNSVNCYRGNERRVYTFPCLRVFLGSTELLRPQDDKLDEFWIDFNLESQRVSFFIDEPEGYLWGAIHLLKQEVNHYSLHCKKNESSEDETILTIHLINPIMHHNSAAQTVEMWFSCEHHSQLEEAAGHVLKSRLTLQNRLNAATEEQAWLPGKPVAIETSADVQTVSSPEILMFEKNPETLERTPHVVGGRGPVQAASPFAVKSSSRCYISKKPKAQSHLRILPLSSPSSGEDCPITKTPGRSTAEFLFDQIRSSTPEPRSDPADMDSGVQVALESSQEQEGEIEQEVECGEPAVFSVGRKRAAPNTGAAEQQLAQRRRAESKPEGEGPHLALKELPAEGTESEEELRSGIMAAFKTFKTQLQEHFTGSWKKVEAEVVQSLSEHPQHFSSLLRAVHHHRLLLLQRFEKKVANQINQLVENLMSLNSIETEVLSKVQSFRTFCDKQLLRLKSLEDEDMKDEEEEELPSTL